MLKIGMDCPHCTKHNVENIGKLRLIKGDEPYNVDHLMCSECSSTYNLDFYPLWQEEINGIAADICDVMCEKLKLYKIDLENDTKKEDELFDLIVNYLEEYGYGSYKKYH